MHVLDRPSGEAGVELLSVEPADVGGERFFSFVRPSAGTMCKPRVLRSSRT